MEDFKDPAINPLNTFRTGDKINLHDFIDKRVHVRLMDGSAWTGNLVYQTDRGFILADPDTKLMRRYEEDGSSRDLHECDVAIRSIWVAVTDDAAADLRQEPWFQEIGNLVNSRGLLRKHIFESRSFKVVKVEKLKLIPRLIYKIKKTIEIWRM